MTREEAITRLKNMAWLYGSTEREQNIEAIDMSIEALKKAEADNIVPNGEIVDLGNYSVHVYAEGDSNSTPTLVFMSGSATVAPVYDFKALYSILADEYRIAVVEKAGYGFSGYV